jgi:hypothetical protein
MALNQKTKAFNNGLFAVAPGGYVDLHGQSLESLPRGGQASLRADVNRQSTLRDVDPQASSVPACVSGRLRPPPAGTANLVVGVNGKVRAVTTTFEGGKFAAMIPPQALRPGANELRLGLLSQGRVPSFNEVPWG